MREKPQDSRGRRAITLIELLVVVAIIGLLGSRNGEEPVGGF